MMTKEKKGSTKAVTGFPRQHRGNRYTMYRLVSLVGVFVIVGLLALVGAQAIQYYKTEQELAGYEKRLQEQEQRQALYMEEIEWLKDYSYIEMLARERLGLVKPGELIFQLED